MNNRNDYFVFAKRAYLSTGWQNNVVIEIENGHFKSIVPHALPPEDALCIDGPVLPTLANVHSHSFQRLMAGMAEISLNPNDSFWSWRELMYKIVNKLTPPQVKIIATQLYIEMLKAGYTQVGEFHYLHHDRSGVPFTDQAEMSYQLINAAEQSGIGITLLPVLYSYSGFNAQPATSGQARFIHSSHSYIKLHQQLKKTIEGATLNNLGICFHSLRAVSQAQMQDVMSELPPNLPVHIHISEQQKEVDDCIKWSGQRPVEWLHNNIGLNDRWCLVHATHLNSKEIHAIAQSQSVVGLCPTTEANLGDGIFPGQDFEEANGRWGIGSDSHVSLSIVEELRTLEYGQRLRDQQRNRLHRPTQNNIGENLYYQALKGGNQACHVNLGLKPGSRADFMTLDHSHPFIMASKESDILNRWLFACNQNLVKDVFVAGKHVIKNGHHDGEENSNRAFAKVISKVIYDA